MNVLLKSVLTIIIGVAIGAVLGLYNKSISDALGIDNFAKLISFPGQLYLLFLQMTVIPIVITAISSSLGKLMRSKSSSGLIKKIVTVLVICMAVSAVIGMACGILGKPGSGLSEETQTLLAKILSSETGSSSGILEVTLVSNDDAIAALQRPGMSSFFTSIIPANIFQALSLGSMMAIVFISIVFGIAIGFLPEDSAILLINLCTALFHVFQKVISWSLVVLPIGLVCLLAGQVASIGVQVFVAMYKFIVLYIIGTAVFFVGCTAVIWFRSGIRNPFKVISMSFEPVLLAFVTSNSMAALPSAINCLSEKFKFNSNSVNLTLPLGLTLGRFGNIFYFAIGVFFIGQIYSTHFEPIHYLIILVGVIFAGTATSGASGVVTLSMLSIVLDPLSLPMEAVLIIFIAIDPIIEPFRTVLNMHINMAATSLVAEQGNKREIIDVDLEIKEAENKIQRSARAKTAGEASEEDEEVFYETNEAIEKLREEKRRLIAEAKNSG